MSHAFIEQRSLRNLHENDTASGQIAGKTREVGFCVLVTVNHRHLVSAASLFSLLLVVAGTYICMYRKPSTNVVL